MIDAKFLDEMAGRLAGGMPAGLQALMQDMERNLRAGLEAAMAKMDLVTREEFDVQCAVLARTREKLHRLEQQVADLERQADLGKTPDA